MKKITVTLEKRENRSYDILIGTDILDRIGCLIAKSRIAERYIIISDERVAEIHGRRTLDALSAAGLSVSLLTFPPGESSKNMAACLDLIGRLVEQDLDRQSALIALGGGVTGDMTGLIASLFMRSIPYIQMPTSLLAMVDSSIGGKTGVDLPQGKNLLGAFYQPRMVCIDLRFLDSLPPEELINGLAETVKYSIIEDIELFGLLEQHSSAILAGDSTLLAAAVERSCTIKKGIVEMDERDMGLRKILNFGHTLGHAVEASSGYEISHGRAVSLGMVAAVRLSEKLKHLASEERARIEDLIGSLELPCSIPRGATTEAIISHMRHDKKKINKIINFVLLKKIGVPFINGSIEDELIRETIEGMRQ